MFCIDCGKQIPEGSAFCPLCGKKQGDNITLAEGNNTPRRPVQLREVAFRAVGRKIVGNLYISIDDMIYTVPYKEINTFKAKVTPEKHVVQVSTSKSNLKLRDMANISMKLSDTNILGGFGSLVAYSTGLASKAVSSITDKDDNVCYVDLTDKEKSIVVIKTDFFSRISLETEE